MIPWKWSRIDVLLISNNIKRFMEDLLSSFDAVQTFYIIDAPHIFKYWSSFFKSVILRKSWNQDRTLMNKEFLCSFSIFHIYICTCEKKRDESNNKKKNMGLLVISSIINQMILNSFDFTKPVTPVRQFLKFFY